MPRKKTAGTTVRRRKAPQAGKGLLDFLTKSKAISGIGGILGSLGIPVVSDVARGLTPIAQSLGFGKKPKRKTPAKKKPKKKPKAKGKGLSPAGAGLSLAGRQVPTRRPMR